MSFAISIDETMARMPQAEDPLSIVVNEMRKLRDHTFGLSDIIDSNIKLTFADVTNTVEQLLKAGKRNYKFIYNHLDELKAYSCVAKFFILVKTYQLLVQDLPKYTKNQNDKDTFNKTNNVLEMLDVISTRVEEFGLLIKKIICEEDASQKQFSREFDHKFGLLTHELRNCASDLVNAEDALPKMSKRMTVDVLKLIYNNVRTLKLSDIFAFFAILAVVIIVLLFIDRDSNTAIYISILVIVIIFVPLLLAKDARDQYKRCDSERKSLQNALHIFMIRMDAIKIAKKCREVEEENRCWKEKLVFLEFNKSPSDSREKLRPS